MEGLVDFNYNSLDLVLRMEIQEQLTVIAKGQEKIDEG
jgi:hypothetical protein